MIKWIRTSRLSIKNSLSVGAGGSDAGRTNGIKLEGSGGVHDVGSSVKPFVIYLLGLGNVESFAMLID